MIKICAKNTKIVGNNDQFVIDEYNGFEGVNILGEQFLLNRIPRTNIGEYNIYFMSKAMSDYIIFDNMEKQFYQVAFELKKNIVNNEPSINEIDTTLLIKENSFLSCFIESSQDGIQKLLIDKLPLLLKSLPYSKNEIEWLQKEIIDLPQRKAEGIESFMEKVEKMIDNQETKEFVFNKRHYCGTKPTNFYDVFGEKLTIRQMSEKYGIRQDTLKARLKKGMNAEEAVTTPVQQTGWRLRN